MGDRCHALSICAKHSVLHKNTAYLAGVGGKLRLLFVTHDLAEDNCHLQPWRTICEAVTNLRGIDVQAELLSLGVDAGTYTAPGIPPGARQLSKRTQTFERDFSEFVRGSNVQLLFWPLSWRQSRRRVSFVVNIDVPVVGYFPGGVYDVRAALVALGKIGIEALPYLLEALTPKRRKVAFLREAGVLGLIAQSETTARKMIQSGWPSDKVRVIYPARSPAEGTDVPKLPVDIERWLAGRPYFLFLGPPSGIRGTGELLRAFDKVASEDGDITLVCLFRPDADTEQTQIIASLQRLKHASRVYAHYDRLKRDDLNAAIGRCYALVLPFLLVPAEIPLVMVEALQWARPILTTDCGGSGEFVERFGLTCPTGSSRALARAMLRLRQDHSLYAAKCRAARVAFEHHPTRREVAAMWRDAAAAALAA